MRSRYRHSPGTARAAPPAFAGFRFPPEVIVVAVRWYLRFGLSYRDVEELLAERGVEVDHVTIYRWVLRFTPLLAEVARPCRHSAGDCWSVDETYVKVAGRWRYVYRAIDQFGQVIDVLVSARRDAKAAHRFFEHAISATKVTPVEVTTDRAPAYPAVLEELLPRGLASHRPVRQQPGRVRPRQTESAAASDARAQRGPQRQGDHRGAWVHTEHSERTLRVGGGRASGPPGGCRVRRAGRGDLIWIKVGSFSMPPAHQTQQCPGELHELVYASHRQDSPIMFR
jgi:transposase-like protein